MYFLTTICVSAAIDNALVNVNLGTTAYAQESSFNLFQLGWDTTVLVFTVAGWALMTVGEAIQQGFTSAEI